MRRLLLPPVLAVFLAVATACATPGATPSTAGPGTTAPSTTADPDPSITVCGVAGSAGCTAPAPPGPEDWPEGVAYRATSISEDGAPKELMPGSELTVRFGPPFELGMDAGCNQLGITAHIDGGRIVPDQFLSTAMGCSPPLMEQDQWLVDFFEQEPLWIFLDEELILSTDHAEITLTPDAP